MSKKKTPAALAAAPDDKVKKIKVTNPAKAEKDKQKNKPWKNLPDKDKIEYLAALLGIGPDTVL
jgi:hypothetical protein